MLITFGPKKYPVLDQSILMDPSVGNVAAKAQSRGRNYTLI